MSDITPIRLAGYEHLAVKWIDAVHGLVEPRALLEGSPDYWDILAFSATSEGVGVLLLGRRKSGGKVATIRT